MSLDERLRSLLLQFGYEVQQGVYTGKHEQYITFNYTAVPISFSDDLPEWEKYLIQIHLYCPLAANPNPLIRKIKAALVESDFTYPEIYHDDDNKCRHSIIETEWAEEVNV